jgi:hypothetical protein
VSLYMTVADLQQRTDKTPEAARKRRDDQERGAVPTSPALSWGWLLRATSLVAIAAAAMGTLVTPGIRGNASDAVVVAVEQCSSTLGYALLLLLVGLTCLATIALVRAREIGVASRTGLMLGAGTVSAAALSNLDGRVPIEIPFVAAAATIIAVLAGAYCAARAAQTRAVGGLLVALGFAAVCRLGAWLLATRAGDAASVQMFAYGRDLATAAVLFEASGQLLAATWLGSRGTWGAQISVTGALAGAWLVTWCAAKGIEAGAPQWQSVLHAALESAAGSPRPYGLDRIEILLIPASLLLALVGALQRKTLVAVLTALALMLVSRGCFDAPLRALCAVAAAQWAALASIDDRAMWRALLAERPNPRRDHDAELAKTSAES